MATQTLIQAPAKNMRITIKGALPAGVTAKELILHVIGTIGTAAAPAMSSNSPARRCVA